MCWRSLLCVSRWVHVRDKMGSVEMESGERERRKKTVGPCLFQKEMRRSEINVTVKLRGGPRMQSAFSPFLQHD
jgi:hypothetical protein